MKKEVFRFGDKLISKRDITYGNSGDEWVLPKGTTGKALGSDIGVNDLVRFVIDNEERYVYIDSEDWEKVK